jgi:hypothetical protein
MPGTSYADSVTVANYTTTPLTFHLYGSDAFNAPGGGLSLRRRTDVRKDIGGWIRLPYPELTVPARAYSVVPFTIVTPRQASPGDHVGGIVAEETQGTTSYAGSVPITVVQAVGVRVYGRVVGPLHPRLVLRELSLSVMSSAVTEFGGAVDAHLHFDVTNSGNTVLSPRTTVDLKTPFGTAARRTFTINQLLPGNSLTYTLSFPDVDAYGRLQAEVAVTGVRAMAAGSVTEWTLPWALLSVILLVLLTLPAWALLRLNRRRRAASSGGEPAVRSVPADEAAKMAPDGELIVPVADGANPVLHVEEQKGRDLGE